MATTAELILQFKGDPSNLKSVMSQVRSELSQTAQVTKATNQGELSMRQQLSAVASLQRQRSTALVAQWKQQEREAANLAKGVQPLATNLQRITDTMQTLARSAAVVQGPLGGVAGRLSSIGAIAGETGGKLGLIGVAIAALVAAAGIATVAITKLTLATAEFQGRLFDLSQQTGVQVETLSTLEFLARTTGSEIGDLSQAFIALQRVLEEAQDPSSKAADALRKIGVEVTDTETALRDVLAALAAMPEGFTQTNAAAEIFGSRGGKRVLAILKEANGDIDAVTKQLRELSVVIDLDAARAADKLNDQLVLLEFQLRGLAIEATRELIPAFTEIVKASGSLLQALRPLTSAFADFAGPVARSAAKALNGLSLAVAAVTQDYRALAEAAKRVHEETSGVIPPAEVAGPLAVPLPGQPSGRDLATTARQQAEAILAEAKRAAEKHNQVLGELFEKGRIKREQEAAGVIANNKKVLDADKARIEALIQQKNEEAREIDRGGEAYRKLAEDIGRLQQELLDKESEFEVRSQAIRTRAAKERANSRRNQEREATELLLGEFDRQIKLNEDNLEVIEQLERAKIDARRESLEEQKRIGFLTIQDQQDIDNQLRALGQEADRLSDDQMQRRLEREKEAAEHLRQIRLTEIDTNTRIQQIAGEREIAAVQSLTERRVITEQKAARRITAIRLSLIDQEIEATKAKLKSAESITNQKDRVQAEADLNNQLKILIEQRKSIELQGNQDIEQGRRQDVDSERRYAEDLLEIRRRIAGIEGEAARIGINLLVLGHARKREVLKAQIALDIQDENNRHQQRLEAVAQERADNVASNRTQEERLQRTAELNRLEEAEKKRHQAAMQEITDQGRRAEILAGPFGGFLTGLETGQLAELQGGVQSFADVATVAFSAVGAAVNGLAQGVGSLVQQWVLMGNQADLSLKKVTASVLSSVSAQAAVQAVMFLAYGIASLTPWGAAIFGPAAPWFKAAALMGSIALIAGGIGRAVAGNSFAGGGEAGGVPQSQQPQTERDRTIREGRTGGRREFATATPELIGRVAVDLKYPDGYVETKMVQIYDRNGRFRGRLRSDLLGEANG